MYKIHEENKCQSGISHGYSSDDPCRQKVESKAAEGTIYSNIPNI